MGYFCKKKHSLKEGEVEHFERVFLHTDMQSIEEIKEDAFGSVRKVNHLVSKLYSSNLDPFQLLDKHK